MSGSGYTKSNVEHGAQQRFVTEWDETSKVPVTDLAQAWEGHRYGLQALKPAAEPIIVFQKPYVGKPIDNMIETGAGALNIEGGRIGCDLQKEDLKRGRKTSEGIGIWGNASETKHLDASSSGR